MNRISVGKRLSMGLGTIALGVCFALPFRHAPPAEMAAASKVPDNQSVLGDGVSLQVPGQRAMATFAQSTLRPVPTEDESDSAVTRSKPAADGLAPYTTQTVFNPPSLPDHYRPLFQPDVNGEGGSKSVVQPARDPVLPPGPAKIHTIRDGDTLEALANRYLGDPQRASEILDANRAVLNDPELLPIGAEILIPRRGSTDVAVQAPSKDLAPSRRLVPLPSIGLRRGQ